MLSPLAATLVCMFLVGAIVSLWDRVPWVLSERLKIPEPMCRDWQAWFSFPLIFLFPLLGHFIDCWDAHYLLFMGILGLALSLAGLGQHRTLRTGLAALLLFCVAIPCIMLPTMAILPEACRKLFEGVVVRQLNKLVLVTNIAFIGVILGMKLTPGLANVVVRRFGVRHGFLGLALLCLVPALVVALTGHESFVQHEPKSLSTIYADGRVWMLAALTFVYYLLAELLGVWKTLYLQQSQKNVPWAGLVFWLAMLVGLPIAGFLIQDRYTGIDQYEVWGVAVLALVYAVVVGNMAGEFTDRSGTLSLAMVGASFAPFLPTLLTIPAKMFPDNAAGTMGLALGAGALGNFLFQPMLQRFTQRSKVSSSLWLSAVLSLALAALALVLALMVNPTGGGGLGGGKK